MIRRKKEPKTVKEVLKGALDKLQISPILKRYEVFENWNDLVGPKIAERSRPVKIQGENLILEVDHPAWAQELNFLKPHLLKKISKHYPKSGITNLRFILRRTEF